MDSKPDFFPRERSASLPRYNGQRREPGRFPMSFISKLSVVTAYLAFAFVGAIVFGVF
jgi:hypothetical protein